MYFITLFCLNLFFHSLTRTLCSNVCQAFLSTNIVYVFRKVGLNRAMCTNLINTSNFKMDMILLLYQHQKVGILKSKLLHSVEYYSQCFQSPHNLKKTEIQEVIVHSLCQISGIILYDGKPRVFKPNVYQHDKSS